MTDKKERMPEIDICKGICMLMVILGHQLEKAGLREQPLQFIQTFHMPLFFIIAGFFISDQISKRDFIKKRANRLLVPYIVTAVTAMVLTIAKLLITHQPKELILNQTGKWLWIIFCASGSDHGSFIGVWGCKTEIGILWYLVALFYGCIIVKLLSDKKLAALIILLISSIGIGSTVIFGWIPFSIQNGMGTAIFVYLGYYIKKNKLLPQIQAAIKSKALLLIIPAWLLSAVFGCIHLYENNYTLGITDMVGCISGSFLVYGICLFIAKHLNITSKLFQWIGRNSLLVYCLHFIEDRVYPASEHLRALGIENSLIYALVCWITVSVLICLITLAIHRIPIIKRIFG